MTVARGRGWNKSSPKILKMDPDNGPYHGEYTGHPCEGQRGVEGKEMQAENTGRVEEEPERRERRGRMLRAAPHSHTGCLLGENPPRGVARGSVTT